MDHEELLEDPQQVELSAPDRDGHSPRLASLCLLHPLGDRRELLVGDNLRVLHFGVVRRIQVGI